MVLIIQNICPSNKWSIKCPYAMTPNYITIHNTAGDASANNEISYMLSNNKETSFHYAVDDTQIIQGLPLDRNGWHAGDGNGKGNRQSIGIEICYSKSGGEKFVKAVQNSAELTASLLHKYGWGIDRVRKHQDWSGKYCPHRILSDYGWQWYLNLVQEYYNGATPNITVTPTVSPVQNDTPNTILPTYQIWDDVKNTWLPNVIGTSDYAGIFGHDICAVYANLSEGNITYMVHEQNGKWYPAVVNRNDYAGVFNKPIDAIAMTTDTGCTLHYKIHIRDGSWLGDVTGYDINDDNNGYAGIIGKPIDGLQMWLDPKPVKAEETVIQETPKPIQPYGYTDHATQNSISGWAYNGKNDAPVEVHINISKNGTDVKHYTGIIADIHRDDLQSAGIGNGNHGFVFEHDFYVDLGEGEFVARAYAIGESNPQLNQTITFTVIKPNVGKIENAVTEQEIELKEDIANVEEEIIVSESETPIADLNTDKIENSEIINNENGNDDVLNDNTLLDSNTKNKTNDLMTNFCNILKEIFYLIGKLFTKK